MAGQLVGWLAIYILTDRALLLSRDQGNQSYLDLLFTLLHHPRRDRDRHHPHRDRDLHRAQLLVYQLV